MGAVFEQGKGRWFYSQASGERPVGPYLTPQQAMTALEKVQPSQQPPEKIPMLDQFDKTKHYAVRKLHARLLMAFLLITAMGVGWELNNLHHPVQLEFCADGPAPIFK